MAKQLTFRDEARRRLKTGIDKTARAVATTLGPKGRNVALDKKWGAPTITHDGVTVAKEVELEDKFAYPSHPEIGAPGASISALAGSGDGVEPFGGARVRRAVEHFERGGLRVGVGPQRQAKLQRVPVGKD